MVRCAAVHGCHRNVHHSHEYAHHVENPINNASFLTLCRSSQTRLLRPLYGQLREFVLVVRVCHAADLKPSARQSASRAISPRMVGTPLHGIARDGTAHRRPVQAADYEEGPRAPRSPKPLSTLPESPLPRRTMSPSGLKRHRLACHVTVPLCGFNFRSGMEDFYTLVGSARRVA